jgi:hypothetical protein
MKIVLLGLLLVAATSSYARTWDESVDGDLDFVTAGSTAPIVLDVGINSFLGSIDYSADPRDFDTINFRVPTDHELTSFHLDYSWVGEVFAFQGIGLQNASSGAGIGDGLKLGNTAYCTSLSGPCQPSSSFPWLSLLPLEADHYWIQAGAVRQGGAPNAILNYEWEIVVTNTAVPVPAAVWLFGSALGMLGWMRRKKND